MERLFIQLSDDVYISIDPYDWFCGPGSQYDKPKTNKNDKNIRIK